MQQDIRWHISNGESIFYKENRRVPLLFLNKPQLKEGHDINITRVFHLINPTSHFWDISTLSRTFEAGDVEKIKAIPLSIFTREDHLVWQFKRRGIYTVKSSHRKAKDMRRRIAQDHFAIPV